MISPDFHLEPASTTANARMGDALSSVVPQCNRIDGWKLRSKQSLPGMRCLKSPAQHSLRALLFSLILSSWKLARPPPLQLFLLCLHSMALGLASRAHPSCARFPQCICLGFVPLHLADHHWHHGSGTLMPRLTGLNQTAPARRLLYPTLSVRPAQSGEYPQCNVSKRLLAMSEKGFCGGRRSIFMI